MKSALTHTLLGVACAGLLGCGESVPPTIDAEGLAGTWVATMEHNGQEGSFAVRFERGEGDAASAVVAIGAIPAIEAWAMPFGPAVIEDGTTVKAGPLVFEWNTQRGSLDAAGLPTLIPKYDIPVVLERSEPLVPAEPHVFAATVEPVWTLDTGGAVWAGCAFDDSGGGTVFAGNDAGEVLAVAASDGTVRWRAPTGGQVRARPTVAGDTLLVHSDDGYLYAFDKSNGRPRWEAHIAKGVFERIPPDAAGSRYDHYASAATVVGNTVFVGAGDGSLHALDLETGGMRWSYQAGDTIAGTPAVADGRVFVGSFDGKVHGLNATTGEPLWEYDTGAAVPSAPAVAEGRVLVGSRSFDFWALDAATGTPVWKFYYWFSWVDSDATVAGSTAYVGSSDALKVYALDVTGGAEHWSFDTGGWTWAQPAVTGDAVFAGTVGITGYIGPRSGGFFGIDRKDGSLLWSYEAAPVASGMWGFAGSPAAGAGKVFAGNLDGRLYAFAQ